MIRHPSFAAVAVAAVLLAATPAAAQSEDDVAAYLALSLTPVGALPSTPAGASDSATSRRFDLLYGQKDIFVTLHHIGFGYSEQRGRSRVGVMVGTTRCDDCDGFLMGGLEVEQTLDVRRLADGATATVGLLPAVGFGKPLGSGNDGLLLSASLGLPVMYTSGGPGWRVSFYGTPGAGFGRVSDDEVTAQGVRPMLGLGMRATSAHGSGVVVGAQHVFIEDAKTQFGVALTFVVGRP